MIFKPYYYFETGCAACSTAAAAWASAPSLMPTRRMSLLTLRLPNPKGVRITHVIDTHVHADHRSGGPARPEGWCGLPACTSRPT